MAGKIQLLSDEVIGKIAAGEVVERPAAAIKEMVENSLDAGATAITVEIRDGGISYFRVTDNGSGIPQGEIRMAFERHATSKITRAQDLFSIQTLGFRGEALASIAAVSHVSCTTRTRQDTSGIKVKNSGGRIESIEEAACPEGTTFVVRDLFFNTPVRLKFLKKPATEAGYVSDLMMRLILSRPDVSFRYINQGKTLYHSAGDGKLSSAVFSIYGKELLRSMREVDGHQAGVVVKGYVGVGDSGRGSRGHQSFFINGRYMKSGVLSAAVEAACRERVLAGRYPTCVLHLTMPYETVDVNVHPNKLEVRFQNEQAVGEAIEAIVRDALIEKSALDKPELLQLSTNQPMHSPVTVSKQETVQRPDRVSGPVIRTAIVPPMEKAVSVPSDRQEKTSDAKQPALPLMKAERKSAPPAVQTAARPAMQPLAPITAQRPSVLREPSQAVHNYLKSTQTNPVPSYPAAKAAAEAHRQELPRQEASFLPEAPRPMKIIGTAFNSYILVEYQDSLLLVDQHGVHERLLFDRMMKAFD
ncbi:MAG: DNA mismatch repair endonuclease MutL [Clostridia bacterium]|nr:DNA mismatch repair endonuclease MutL [Clostridia bacterium]